MVSLSFAVPACEDNATSKFTMSCAADNVPSQMGTTSTQQLPRKGALKRPSREF